MSGGFMPKGTGNMTVVPKEKHPAWTYFKGMVAFNTKHGIDPQIDLEDNKSGCDIVTGKQIGRAHV